jgi:site-specific DNA-methyltransferase (adenine-specific)
MIQDLLHRDYRSLLAEIPDESADLVFTDPPYWTLDKHRNAGTTTRLGGNRDKSKQTGWFETIDKKELKFLLREIYRVLKKDRHAFVMCDGQTLKYVLAYVERAGFNYFKPIVWDKVKPGLGYHLRSQHEFIVLLDKGKNRQPKSKSVVDIVRIPKVLKGYPTEKPVELPFFFIDQYANPGEMVIDPFCGSGSTLVAARRAGCQFIGGDASEEAIQLAANNVAKTLIYERFNA